ncbi:MAG TPA: DinB family protein [Candidatus Hydrogenedentes bacterium]|nr:DinB family protein [Candidatus Hydrogenedentota bacterium]HOS01604.1 DinB family protein [Candidatus Hydrogenedentota bacterium]
MSIMTSLREEFNQESAVTRRILACLPEHRFGWKPHPKSMSLGHLANHIVDIVGWTGVIVRRKSFEFDSAHYVPTQHDRLSALLEAYDVAAADAAAALTELSDNQLGAPWRLVDAGRTIFELPRLTVLRSWMFHHTVHHRAQLTVYLRLNDIPVPSVYGPSADTQ